jgi:CDP-diacylglycerol---serine O-phosphatidyltransferase
LKTQEPIYTSEWKRGIYLLPNFFTTFTLFAAFYAIIAGIRHDFPTAAIAVYIAMLADALDGRVARLTNTQTHFGAEYDSLADIVAFGLTPALLIYLWGLHELGKYGWLVSFIYTAAGALRLARFNSQLNVASKVYSQGLPITAAAPIIASFVWLSDKYEINAQWVIILASVITLIISGFMVSNIRYPTFKQGLNFGYPVRFMVIIAPVIVCVIISLDPPTVIFLIFLSYAVSGLFLTLWRLRQARLMKKYLARQSESNLTGHS